MSLAITSRQRDALYDRILDRLSGIGDVWLAVCAENYGAAERLGREYSDDLGLVLDDPGPRREPTPATRLRGRGRWHFNS
jgi:hypothetical protein